MIVQEKLSGVKRSQQVILRDRLADPLKAWPYLRDKPFILRRSNDDGEHYLVDVYDERGNLISKSFIAARFEIFNEYPGADVTPRCTRCSTPVDSDRDLTSYDNDLMCAHCLYLARLPFDCTQCAVEVMEGA